MLEASFEGCGAYCEGHTEQLMFDARTGRVAPTADLLTREGAKALARRTFEHKLRKGRALLAEARRANRLDRDNDEEGTYRRCLREWTDWAKDGGTLFPLWLDGKGRWQVHVEPCSAHVNRPQDLLDHLHMPVTLAELRPPLSAYGRSLLLGEGDIRTPVETPDLCEGPMLPMALTPPAAPGPRSAADEETATWLSSEAQPLTWRTGERYTALAQGQRFAAGLREDASLWTWGSNYQGRLGTTTLRETETPQFLLDNVAQVSLDTNVGLALKRDGTLWVWGEAPSIAPRRAASPQPAPDPTPRQIFDDVVQAVSGPQGDALALRRDGSLWRIGGPENTRLDRPVQPPQKLGEGFVRLAGHHAEAAWRTDGTLWAWNETLIELLDVNEPNLPPVPVARDVLQVMPRAHAHITALLKTDGSVWTKQGWGGTYALRRVACGYRQLARAGEREVLGLRADGQLVAWRSASELSGRVEPGAAFLQMPVALGTGFTGLWSADFLGGHVAAVALAQRGADELWTTRTEPRSGEAPVAVRAMLQRVVAPK